MAETNKKILIVEDDLAMREIMQHKLTASGFTVLSAEDGKQGLEIIKSEVPDIVLLDLMMPELDGFGVLELLRKDSDVRISEMPVIVLSNLWSNIDILKAKSLKVKGFLVKAYFTPDQILGKIKEVLAGKAI